MLQLIGILTIMNSLIIMGWWAVNDRGNTASLISVGSIGSIAILVGLVLTFHERAIEISLKGVGTIKAAAQQASVDAQQILDLRKRVETQSATVDLVAKEAADATKLTKDLKEKATEADFKLEKIDNTLKEASEKLKSINEFSEFHTTVLAAQSDSRPAFDQLKKWADDTNSPLSKFAIQTWAAILDIHAPMMYTSGFQVPWQNNVDPAKLNLNDLKSAFNSAPKPIRLALMEYVWKREDFSKRDRMAFMVEILKDSQSLAEVEYAGRYFMEVSQQKLKPLAVEQLLDWWEKNKDTVK